MAQTVLDAAGKDGKMMLTENTEKAFASGAFGLPWMLCANNNGQTEGFWGVDHLGQVANFLSLERPSRARWKSVL
jgi:2-hydroxychromene-2-carboxylate isomerase